MLAIVTVSSFTSTVCVEPLTTPSTHSGATDTENAFTPWLLTVEGTIHVTRMLVALRERALTDTVSVLIKRPQKMTFLE